MNFKIFNDSIHGHIELHPLCVKIIDTPQFQRLRSIQQLGTLYRVYPGASHNRFEHCIGVCHLAGELLRELRSKQPELNISDEDHLCIVIAGLCHDLGHGPFSHVFDNKFLPCVHSQKRENLKHENISISMFDYMVESNNLIEKFEAYNLNRSDIEFIKELIIGNENSLDKNLTHRGRTRDKHFLYEIVANKYNGIDMDKCDYLIRDSHHLGVKCIFDHRRLIKQARVIINNDTTNTTKEPFSHICFRDIEACNLYNFFYSRQTLYRSAYCHKTCTIIDEMIVEGLLLANDYYKIEGRDRKTFRISEAYLDMAAYEKLTNNIYYTILHSTDKWLSPAKVIFNRIERRDLYKFLGEVPTSNLSAEDLENAKKKVANYSKNKLTANDFVLQVIIFDYGMGKSNPMDFVWFYTKEDPNQAKLIPKEEISNFLPEKFCEYKLRAYCKKTDEGNIIDAKKCFEEYCKMKNTKINKDL